MSELTEYHPSGQVAVMDVDPTGGRLVAWAQAASAANALAKSLAQTAFVPRVKASNGQMVPISPGDATAAILMGDELGLSPLAALRSVYVVHGTPALYARTMAALVMSHGHEVWTVEESEQRVTVAGRRRGSDHEERVTWTMDRARKAGYTKNQKYQTNPVEMLYARAVGDIARRIAPDVLAGVPYSVEEIELSQEPATTAVTREPGAKRTVARRSKPEPDEPPLDDAPVAPEESEDAAEPEADDEEPGVTAAQLKNIGRLMTKADITERTHALEYVATVVGRKVGSRKELTVTEASALIEALMRDVGETGNEPDETFPGGAA